MTDCTFLSKYQVAIPGSSSHQPKLFPEDFVPSNKDVICGRGKATFRHVGNRRFRVIIAMNLNKYVNSKSKMDKSIIVTSIVEQVRQASVNGGFVKKNAATGRWMSIDDDLARDKVGHALRDAVSSSKQAAKRSMITSDNIEVRLVQAQQAILRSLQEEPPLNSTKSVAVMSV